MMPYINHPARQGDKASVADWLRYHIGSWMWDYGAVLQHRALHPDDFKCPDCGSWHRKGFECDDIPF